MPRGINDSDDSLKTAKEACMFVWIFLLFILSWISVAVVGRAIDNFTFSTLKLNEKSTYHTVIIALVILAIEIATISYFNSIGIVIYDSSSWDCNNTNDNENSSDGDMIKYKSVDHIKFSSIDQIMKVTNLTII